MIKNFENSVVKILSYFRVILELKTTSLIGVWNSSWNICVELSIKKFKSFQNLLLGNPAISSEFF